MSTPLLPDDIHPGWIDLIRRLQHNKFTRRAFIPGALAAAGMAMGRSPLGALIGSASAKVLPDRADWPSTNKIKHVVILCQENRSFDHYFGSFANTLGTPGD